MQSLLLGRATISEVRTFKDLLDAELSRTRWSLAELELLARSTMGTTAGPGTTAKPSPKSTNPPISPAQAPGRERSLSARS